jgi:hypothetical protein
MVVPRSCNPLVHLFKDPKSPFPSPLGVTTTHTEIFPGGEGQEGQGRGPQNGDRAGARVLLQVHGQMRTACIGRILGWMATTCAILVARCPVSPELRWAGGRNESRASVPLTRHTCLITSPLSDIATRSAVHGRASFSARKTLQSRSPILAYNSLKLLPPRFKDFLRENLTRNWRKNGRARLIKNRVMSQQLFAALRANNSTFSGQRRWLWDPSSAPGMGEIRRPR